MNDTDSKRADIADAIRGVTKQAYMNGINEGKNQRDKEYERGRRAGYKEGWEKHRQAYGEKDVSSWWQPGEPGAAEERVAAATEAANERGGGDARDYGAGLAQGYQDGLRVNQQVDSIFYRLKATEHQAIRV
ncbi:hypothetical protein LCGC14_2431910 [marine sediment metagenome]|uniref:Uncharacterized protein n=1 Tax=marine sediment metagenome TaxID=412755 RepID=A0A0F9BLS2_9ZZZZ